MKFAFAGFRHDHIFSLYNHIKERQDCQITASCEEDAPTREKLAATGRVNVTHHDYKTMLAEVECDAVAIGDYYSRRGEIAIAAMRAGKHVILDKPICTSLPELDEIEALAKEKKLAVQCMLDLRCRGQHLAMKRLLEEGRIGRVHTIMFQGLHPLVRDIRPSWYFEEGKHGGTINDIAIHGVDLALWMTNQTSADILAARAWNAVVTDVPTFQDCAQLMFRLGDGCGVIGDVSYLAPAKFGYRDEQYWRICCHGFRGVMETYSSAPSIKVATHEDETYREFPPDPHKSLVYFNSLLAEAGVTNVTPSLTTQEVLRASRITLEAQKIADSAAEL